MALTQRGKKKLDDLRRAFVLFANNVSEDGAVWLQTRIVEEILNGETGSDYPKAYSPGLSRGPKVGVVTGSLRRSVQVRKGDIEFTRKVLVDPSASAIQAGDGRSYAEYVNNWAKERYGKGFMEIAALIYGDILKGRIREEFQNLVRSIALHQMYNYTNQF